jgi:8-oxo-dGTP diphosphatase
MKEPIRKLDGPGDPHAVKPVRLVVAALILRQPDPADASALEVLICQRKPDQPMSLKWEFPGGKIEPGESPEEALARELQEELGIRATIGRKVARINDVRWSSLPSLPRYDFLAADLGLIRDLSEGKLL